MKTWDYDNKPYRPVERRVRPALAEGGKSSQTDPGEPDAFLDANGRVWYADGRLAQETLPADPLEVTKIPPQFWHPSVARREHSERKRKLEDERAERANR